jgi:WD40 repeat protein
VLVGFVELCRECSVRLPQRLGVTPVIIHNNCIIGHDSKVRRFKAHALWFADDDALASACGVDARCRTLAQCVHAERWQSALVHTLRGHRELVTALRVFKIVDATVLLSASYDKTIRIWNIEVSNLVL